MTFEKGADVDIDGARLQGIEIEYKDKSIDMGDGNIYYQSPVNIGSGVQKINSSSRTNTIRLRLDSLLGSLLSLFK